MEEAGSVQADGQGAGERADDVRRGTLCMVQFMSTASRYVLEHDVRSAFDGVGPEALGYASVGWVEARARSKCEQPDTREHWCLVVLGLKLQWSMEDLRLRIEELEKRVLMDAQCWEVRGAAEEVAFAQSLDQEVTLRVERGSDEAGRVYHGALEAVVAATEGNAQVWAVARRHWPGQA